MIINKLKEHIDRKKIGLKNEIDMEYLAHEGKRMGSYLNYDPAEEVVSLKQITKFQGTEQPFKCKLVLYGKEKVRRYCTPVPCKLKKSPHRVNQLDTLLNC